MPNSAPDSVPNVLTLCTENLCSCTAEISETDCVKTATTLTLFVTPPLSSSLFPRSSATIVMVHWAILAHRYTWMSTTLQWGIRLVLPVLTRLGYTVFIATPLLLHMQTTGHNWHVHENPPMENTLCVDAIGGHYNPFGVSLGKTTSSVCVSNCSVLQFSCGSSSPSKNDLQTTQFLRLPIVQFLITCSMQKWGEGLETKKSKNERAHFVHAFFILHTE